MRFPNLADIDAQLAENKRLRAQASDILSRCLGELARLAKSDDDLLDERNALSIGVPVRFIPDSAQPVARP